MRFYLFLILTVISLNPECNAQTYGLEFASQNFHKDFRTGLELNPDEAFILDKDLEITFKLSLYNRNWIFGYVMRAIINDTINIDIQTNYSQGRIGIISVIVGQQIHNFPSWTIDENLFNEWEEFKVRFNVAGNQIHFIRGGQDNKVEFEFPRRGNITFNFGAIGARKFITTDVPSMRIKDIQVCRGAKLMYKWLLDETEGNKTYDVIGKRMAEITNPHWLSPKYNQWVLGKRLSFSGIVVSAFNGQSDEIFFLTTDSLVIYTPVNKQIRSVLFSGAKQKIFPDSRIIFDQSLGKLYHYYLDNSVFIEFDSIRRNWKHNTDKDLVISRLYTQHNGGFSIADTSFYFFGGYGFHKYKNRLFKYDIPAKTFVEIKLQGDYISPRYLSSMNFSSKKGYAYLLGGYGSLSGDQRINPQSFKDLYLLDLNAGTSKKICNMNSLPEDYGFARSFWMFEKENNFYALGFSQHKYFSWLKLIKGDIKSCNFTYLGDSIPFLFDDTRSMADLYFSAKAKEMICLTSITTEKKDSTTFEIYTIQFPPNLNSGSKDNLSGGKVQTFRWGFIAISLVIVALGFIVALLVKRKHNNRWNKQTRQKMNSPVINDAREHLPNRVHYRNSILFLRQFQLFDKNGTEISNMFSPLLKELFLLVFFYSQNERLGISTELLNQILWSDMSSSQARNNRSVNISKLRYILSRVEGLNLEKRNNYWYIETDPSRVKTDFLEIGKYLRGEKLLETDLSGFLSIVKSGALLPESDYEWLDKEKSDFANNLLDLLIEIEKLNRHDPDISIKIADAMFVHDSLNEDALKLKYNALIHLGRHHLAKSVLDQFKLEYFSLYGEPFEESKLY